MKNSLKLGLLSAILLLASPAFAATATGNLSVTATIAKSCVVSTTAVDFGSTYDPTNGAAIDGTGTITVSCVKGTPVTSVTLGNGGNYDSTGAKRQMSDGAGSKLSYDLYSDSSRSTAWTGSASGFSGNAPGITAPKVLNVYGRIPGGQDVVAGTYNDTVVVTVTY